MIKERQHLDNLNRMRSPPSLSLTLEGDRNSIIFRPLAPQNWGKVPQIPDK
ncbi:hypothetical protein [Spirulina sp. 06S082]|uniref:hypothetical protein n=1 Tax=Spirulina sp. 06S082 TaxID=3110248 RepID=UPI002B1EC48E|nr:hypothetical protein [Spirulina sp. 06S082]MEA5468766.1 hypothetical protein [Spirulina sp. 06S082]